MALSPKLRLLGRKAWEGQACLTSPGAPFPSGRPAMLHVSRSPSACPAVTPSPPATPPDHVQDHTLLPGDRSAGAASGQVPGPGPPSSSRPASSPGPVCRERPPPLTFPESFLVPAARLPSLFPHPSSWNAEGPCSLAGVTEWPHPRGILNKSLHAPGAMVVEGRRGQVMEGLRQSGCCGRRLGWGSGAGLTLVPPFPQCTLPGGLPR